jgi:glycosyltransferase involved in cell wall biosynthesis
VNPITVVIPVGPRAEDCAYLAECLDSVLAQTVPPVATVIVDDMAGLELGGIRSLLPPEMTIMLHRNPWLLGVAASFNVGVAVAPTEHVALLGADDRLEPDALECAQRAIERHPYEQAYFYFTVRYSDGRPDQTVPCGAAVVTKALWRATGGFPVESAVGRSDVMLTGLLMKRPDIGTLVPILDNGTPCYWYRSHENSHTASRGPWTRALDETAQAFWNSWGAPRWGRYS